MKLATLLTKEQILMQMRSTERDEAIEELVDHLDEGGFLEKPCKSENYCKKEILEALQAREDQISTGIGSGVAIPHAFSDKVDQVITIFGRSSEGIDFEALDHAPVKFIVLFIVPQSEYHKHLQTLAAIAKLFTNCEVRKQLATAETKEEILEIFASRPSRADVER